MDPDEESGPRPGGADVPVALLEFTVEEDSAGARVDAALAELSGTSRAQVRRWIDAGRVRVSDEVVRPSRRLAVGEKIEARPSQPIAMELVPEPIPLCRPR